MNAEYQKEWREKNPERQKEYNHKYQQKNPGKARESRQKYYYGNLNAVRERARLYASENKEKRRVDAAEWNKNNPEKYKEIRKRSRQKNKEKIKIANKQWREKNVEHMKNYRKEYHKKPEVKAHYKDYMMIWHLNKREKLVGSPRPEKCPVCGRTPMGGLRGRGRICVDHCHQTGKIRGWLCDDCNVALGRVDDRIDILKNLIKYLTKNL